MRFRRGSSYSGLAFVEMAGEETESGNKSSKNESVHDFLAMRNQFEGFLIHQTRGQNSFCTARTFCFYSTNINTNSASTVKSITLNRACRVTISLKNINNPDS